MTTHVLHTQAKAFARAVPEIKPGYTVRVHEKIQEGGKERVQIFEGLVISVHKGHISTDASFTVRRVVSGIGVEKVFALHSPSIEKIEVKKVAKVRRAKLFFLRGRSGKAARMIERFTTEGEFSVAIAQPEAQEEVEVMEEAPASAEAQPVPSTVEGAGEPVQAEETPVAEATPVADAPADASAETASDSAAA
jgi:large subunit ribosomal protein L19